MTALAQFSTSRQQITCVVINFRHLGQRVQLECDGQRIPLPELQGIVVLNIPSFMGGTNFWGGTRGDDIFLAPSFDDRVLEVIKIIFYINRFF